MKRFLFIAYSIFVCLLLAGSVLTSVSGQTFTTSYYGFAFDREQNLYLGKDGVISVIDTNGNQIRTLRVPTSRGYKFTLLDNEYILVYTGQYFHKLDLLGNNVQTVPVTDENRKDELKMSYRKFVSVDGTEYVMRNRFFRPCVYRLDEKDDVLIYRMPASDYVARLMSGAFLVNLFIFVLIIVRKCRMSNKMQGDL